MYNEVRRYLEKIGEIDKNEKLNYSSLIESMCEVSWEPDEDVNTLLIPIISVRYKQSIS